MAFLLGAPQRVEARPAEREEPVGIGSNPVEAGSRSSESRRTEARDSRAQREAAESGDFGYHECEDKTAQAAKILK